MSRRSSSSDRPGEGFIWSLTLREAIALVLVADLMILGKMLVRIPIHVPGHSGIVWVALMLIGWGLVPKRGAGLLMGLIAGVLATLFGMGSQGILVVVRYAAAGLVLDVMATAFRGNLQNIGVAAIVGACVHLAKLTSMLLVGVIMQLPMTFLAAGLGFSATTHVVFGAIGGVLAALVLRQLRHVPFLRPSRPVEPSPTPRTSSADESGEATRLMEPDGEPTESTRALGSTGEPDGRRSPSSPAVEPRPTGDAATQGAFFAPPTSPASDTPEAPSENERRVS